MALFKFLEHAVEILWPYQRSCVTPSGKRGVCLPSGSCGRHTLSGNSNYMSGHCKRVDGIPTVCCHITRSWLHQKLVRFGSSYNSPVASSVYVRDEVSSSVSDSIEVNRRKRSNDDSSTNTSDTLSSSTSPPNETIKSSTDVPTTSSVSLSNSSSNDAKNDYANAFPEPPVCGVSQGLFGRVVGGNNANLGDFPWIAAIAYRVKGGFFFKCGGSLITSQHTLTAAHCIVGNENSIYFVRFGELDITDHSQNRPVDNLVKTMIVHERYNASNNANDIGILVLKRILIFTDVIRPICLPLSEELRKKDFVDYQPFIAGWGRTRYQGPGATHLQMLQLPVVTLESCKKAYEVLKFLVIDQRNICAGGFGGKDACNGDSGGPLMQPIWDPKNLTTYFYQTGIVSLGMKCGTKGFPTVFVRVTEYISWIQKRVLGTEAS